MTHIKKLLFYMQLFKPNKNSYSVDRKTPRENAKYSGLLKCNYPSFCVRTPWRLPTVRTNREEKS